MSVTGYWQKLWKDSMPKDIGEMKACFCVGPQNGEPLCPCRMRDVIVRDGRYIKIERETDLGPVPKEKP